MIQSDRSSHAFDTFNAVIDAHVRPSDRARLPPTWGVTGLKYRETCGNHMSKSCQNFQRRVAVAALCLVCTPVHAQDFRQTVVVTAAARPVELGSVTRTMTVITRAADRGAAGAQRRRRAAAGLVDRRARARRARRPDRLRASRRQLRPDAGARRRRAAERRAVRSSQRRHTGAARSRGAHRDSLRSRVVALWCRCVRRHGQHHHASRLERSRRDRGRQLRSDRRPGSGGCEPAETCASRFGVSVDRSSGFMYDRDFKTSPFCGRARRSAIVQDCRSRISGRSSARTTSTAATRRRASGRIRRSSPCDHRFGEVEWLEHRWPGVVSHARRSVCLQPTEPRAVRQPASDACGARCPPVARARLPAAAR